MIQRKATAIVGAGWGDEGKGRAVDELASEAGGDLLVVRFNGGAQAAHTVVLPDGRRHVFGHVGAGALAGAATFLSRFFVSAPPLLLRELQDLAKLGVKPRILADARGLVTTPWDMRINQLVETARGGGRHGSCGIGFGETFERSLRDRFRIRLGDLQDEALLRDRLRSLARDWVPHRLFALGLAEAFAAERSLFLSDHLIEAFLADVRRFKAEVEIVGDTAVRQAPHLLFEGAQGLMLDQHRGVFPYVTRSSTGLLNVRQLLEETGAFELTALYMTRSYATRHGAGPLPHEVEAPPVAGFSDPTNLPNRWQGGLRFAPLDLDLLARSISTDLKGMPVSHVGLAVTCLDQSLGAAVRFVQDGAVRASGPEGVADRAAQACGLDLFRLGWGPERGALARVASAAA